MSRKCLISAGQLFSLLLVSSLIIMVTTNSTWTGGGDFLDNIISCAIAFAVNFIAVIPLGLLSVSYTHLDVYKRQILKQPIY